MKRLYTLFCFIYLLAFFLPLCSALAQNTSNKGKDFWLAYPAHLSELRSSMSLYITSSVSTTGTVSIPGQNYSQNFTVNANVVTIVDIPDPAYISSSEVVENKGIQVTSKDPVVIFSHIYSQNQSGSTLALPTPTMGREYYIISHADAPKPLNSPIPPYSEFTVVAIEDNTTVQIIPTDNTIGGKKVGEVITVTLNKGQVYQVQSLGDLTGTKVESISTGGNDCKRIAVFSGSSYTRMGCDNASSGDNLYQQLYPVSAWGQNYATAPTMTRGGDKFRILASENNTTIKVNATTTVTLDQGKYYEFINNQPNYIEADKPILLAQYSITQNCDGVTGDPEMIILSSVEQTLKDITVYSSPFFRISKHYINVVMATKDIASFRLDGNPVVFTPIPSNPLYSYAQKEVSEGNHNLNADAGFTAMAYGFGNVESYGYSAGANVKNLNQNITFDSEIYCDGDEVSFTGFATYEPQSWHWDFGDGNTSSEQNPKHIYAAPGTYEVTLTTVKNNGNDCDSKDETSAELIVYPNPEPAFAATAECLNEAILFEDQSTVSGEGNTVVKWLWEFGDGASSTEQNPRHPYKNPGKYTVKLTSTSDKGCSGTITKEITVLPKPVPNFEATTVCNGFATNFTDKSVTSDQITDWEWDFGDGKPSKKGQNIAYTYAESGTYDVTLTIYFGAECKTSITKKITVYPKPEVAMELPDICISDEAQFENNTTIKSGTVTYSWDFGDGSTSTLKNPRHRYTAVGVYKVKLTATSDKGCFATLEKDYTVSGANPKANFSTSGSCQLDGVQFTDESEVAFGNIVKWEWDFGDGKSSSEQNPLHVYEKAGTYTVTLKAYSGIVCYGTYSKTVTVFTSPKAGFTTNDICFGETSSFRNTSSIAQGNLVAHHWDFGDGTTSASINPSHAYQQAGTYEVTLTVTSEKGCQNSFKQQVKIFAKPKAAFSPLLGCISDPVVFKNESTVTSNNITSWHWDFGDGSSATTQSPSHQFKQAGTYKVRLEVATADGCTDFIEQEVNIMHMPVADAGPDQLPICGVTSTTLAGNKPTHGTGLWVVLSGQGGEFSDPTNPTASFSGSMGEQYTLRWTVSNSPCAAASDEMTLKFSPNPEVNAGPDLEIIEGESIQLQGSGTGTLKWTPATDLSDASIAEPLARPLETTVYTLQATSAEGCVVEDEMTLKVLPKLRIPNGISPNGDGINDVWLLKGVEEYPQISVEVYNRWGDKVFTSHGYSEPWDGTRNGAPLPDGAYYYIIDTNKGRKAFTGSITIVR